MKKNKTRKIMCSILLILMLVSLVIFNNTITADAKTSQLNEDEILVLEQAKETVVIDDVVSIKNIMDTYNLGDAESVEKIIYVPFEKAWENTNEINVNSRASSSKYYIKKIGSFNGAGALLRDSWYVAPGGTMTVSQTVSLGCDFANISQIEGGFSELKGIIGTTYGVNMSSSITVSDSQNIEVKTGCKKNVKAYVWETTYRYEVWKNGLLNDSKIGYGTWDKPLGVTFIVGQNISLG